METGRGEPYSTSALQSEIARAQASKKPLQITAKADGVTALYRVDYEGGLRYPHLVRVTGRTDYLQQILAPKLLNTGS
jgi:hypothetical protein